MPPSGHPGLRALTDGRVRIGAALSAAPLYMVPAYRATAAREFDIATPENEFKWAITRPAADRFNFCPGDAIASFARDNGLQLRGHTLVWGKYLPAWLVQGHYSREQLLELMHEHISTVVGHFKKNFPGVVVQWDVVNEIMADCPGPEPCGLRADFWARALGPDYVAQAFQFAHEADPDAQLFYNEYGIEGTSQAATAKRRGVLQLLRYLRQAGVPVHGIGMQMHVNGAGPPADVLRAVLAQIATLDLDLAITEFDAGATAGGVVADAAHLQRQATAYANALDACLREPRCRTFVNWGFSDAVSWRIGQSACMFDREYQPKPAYQALRRRLLRLHEPPGRAPQAQGSVPAQAFLPSSKS